MPIPGHQLLSPDWAAGPGAAAVEAMTATVRVLRADGVQASASSSGATGWSKGTRPPAAQPAPAPAQPRVIWEGPARLQAQQSSALSTDVADQQVTTRLYLVQLPRDPGPTWVLLPPLRAGTTDGDRVVVTACPDDPQFIGRELRVVDVQHGSLRWTRDLVCSDSFAVNNPKLKETP